MLPIPRLTHLSARRVFTLHNRSCLISKFAVPAVVATSRIQIQSRPATTQPVSPSVSSSDPNSLLTAQRRLRPISPHLSIYQPQITWYLSSLNRITGCVFSGGIYIFGAAYLVAPLFGWHLESAALAAAFGAWPVAAKVACKGALALPFTFHCWNGVRHLVWDTGRELSNRQVVVTGWTVVGLTVASSGVLAFI